MPDYLPNTRRLNFLSLVALTSVACLSGCAPKAAAPIFGLPPVAVQATGQTEPVGTIAADAADDPAIWRNASDPAASLIVATDKKAGLYVYGLDGKIRSFIDAGRVNNVDLVEVDGRIIVAASDRNEPKQSRIALFVLNPDDAKLTPIGYVASGPGEGYGICIKEPASAGMLEIFAVLKAGTVNHVEIALGASSATGAIVRTMKIPTQTEGCVLDKAGNLYVGEELAGIWRFFGAKEASSEGALIATVDNQRLVADVEGLAIVREATGLEFLIASSQGDSAYAVWVLPDMRYAGRFAITAGEFGATSETDGIAAMAGDFGPSYPYGLFIAQDGNNAPAAQNFKLVPWQTVKAALGIQ
jgi:3-phytase